MHSATTIKREYSERRMSVLANLRLCQEPDDERMICCSSNTAEMSFITTFASSRPNMALMEYSNKGSSYHLYFMIRYRKMYEEGILS